jgi:hypothetical protein
MKLNNNSCAHTSRNKAAFISVASIHMGLFIRKSAMVRTKAPALNESSRKQQNVSGWGQSVIPPLRDTNLFDNTHPKISLYVEALKL